MLSTATNANQLRNRLNGSTLAAVVGGFGGGGATLNTLNGTSTTWKGPASTIGGNGAGVGQIFRCTNGPFVWLTLLRTRTMVTPGADDYAVTNVRARYAHVGRVGAQTLDSGLCVTNNGGGLITGGGATVGFAFIHPSLNVVTFNVLPVALGAVTSFVVTPAGYDETKLNEYQIIFQSANQFNDATLGAYINGQLVKTLSWTAATIGVTMPDPGNTVPWVPNIIVGTNTQLQLKIPAGFQLSTGPTLADTL